MAVVLGANQYGKAENRVVRIVAGHRPARDPRPERVHVAARGLPGGAHRRATRPTCCPPNPEEHRVRLRQGARSQPRRRTTQSPSAGTSSTPRPAATGAQIRVEQYAWDRIPVGADGHDHAFVRRGGAVRTTVVTVDGRGAEQRVWVVSGVQTWWCSNRPARSSRATCGQVHDAAGDRRADTRHLAGCRVALHQPGRRLERRLRRRAGGILETFATTYSRALQETLYLMGERVLGTARRSPRSSSRRRTSTISWSTSSRSGSRTTTRSSSPPTARTG